MEVGMMVTIVVETVIQMLAVLVIMMVVRAWTTEDGNVRVMLMVIML